MTGPAPNPLADVADEALSVNAPHTATIQELHLVALHLVCAAFDTALGAPLGQGSQNQNSSNLSNQGTPDTNGVVV